MIKTFFMVVEKWQQEYKVQDNKETSGSITGE